MNNDLSRVSLPLIICIIACLVSCFSGMGGHDLWTPDEPRAAAISLEMAATGDMVIPSLAGSPFVEKPPLYFAVSAFMLHSFGSIIGNTAALRLTAALFGIGVLLMTFLIAKKIGGIYSAVQSTLILATMVGFIQNYHWIRVDAALSFFIAATVWCFVKVYYDDRPLWLIAAGFLISCAFLSKGIIGPVLIAVPWAGLVLYWAYGFMKNKSIAGSWIILHLLCFLAFAGLSGLWMIKLYFNGGEQLWNEWFWINQVGRFTGNAVGKGHLKEGEPFYYILQLLIYGMPWTPLFLFWFVQENIQAIKKRIITRETFFLLVWGAGSVLLLSIPTTKRGIYLTPVLPAFAIMAGLGLQKLESKAFLYKWFKKYAVLWISLSVLLLCMIAAIPLIARFIPGNISEKVFNTLIHPDYFHWCISSGTLFVLAIVLYVYKKQFSTQYKIVIATAMLFIAFWGLPAKAIDAVKSMETDIQQFVALIPKGERNSIAGTKFSETMLGSIYYYTGWKVPQIDDEMRIIKILKGNDKEYTALLVNKKKVRHKETELVDFKYHIVQYTVTGRDRGLFLIKQQH